MVKRMSFPKKKEDIEKVVEEVEESHHHHDHHHHHHHEHHDEELERTRMLVETVSARLVNAEAKIDELTAELARVYKVLAHIVEILQSEDPEAKKRAISEAIKALE